MRRRLFICQSYLGGRPFQWEECGSGVAVFESGCHIAVKEQHGFAVEARNAHHHCSSYVEPVNYPVHRSCPSGVEVGKLFAADSPVIVQSHCKRKEVVNGYSPRGMVFGGCSRSLSLYQGMGLPRWSALQGIGISAVGRNGQAINDTPTLLLADCKHRHTVAPAATLAAPASMVGNRPIRDFLTLGVEFPVFSFPFLGAIGSFSFPVAKVGLTAQRKTSPGFPQQFYKKWYKPHF